MSTEPTSRTPTFVELLRLSASNQIDEVHTCLPGRVTEYDSEKQKVSVQPLIQRRVVLEDGEEILEDLPIIPDVPVAFYRTNKFFVTVPIAKDDLVTLHFAERSLDNWLSSEGDLADPDEFRRHDLTDAIAVPGLYPFTKPIKDIDTEALALGHDEQGMQLHIGKDKVTITFDNGGTLEVTGKDQGANLKLGDGAVHPAIVEKLEILYNQLLVAIQAWALAHIHDFPASSGTPTGIALPGVPLNLPAWDPSIKSNKVSFNDG